MRYSHSDQLALRFIFNSAIALTILFLVGSCSENKADEVADIPTFYEDLAPVMFTNCTPCHRQGGAAPFSLTSYRDAKKRARLIKKVTADRLMPPWPADPTYRSFPDEKILSDNAINLFARWADAGAPEGDSSHALSLPHYPQGSNLGKPDLVLKLPEIPIKGDGQDRFLLVKVPYEIPNDTFIRAVEFVPDRSEVVHHMNANLVHFDESKKSDVNAGVQFLDTDLDDAPEHLIDSLGLLNDDGSYPLLSPMICNYLPGVYGLAYPQGIGGWKMSRKGALFINDLHYGPSGNDTVDQSTINIFYAKEEPKRKTAEIMLGSIGIGVIEPPLVIPPDTIMTFRVHATVQSDISLLTINPHMHLLGKSFLAYAVTPLLDTIPLIRIPKWDFRWQFFYTFEKMLKIPAGTTIYVEAEMDNTDANPNNPFNPPRTVMERDGSMRAKDEMLQFIMTYLPYLPGDEDISLYPDDLGSFGLQAEGGQ